MVIPRRVKMMAETVAEQANGIAGRAGEWLPLREAAERLGVSLDSVRRRLRTNTLRGRQEPILGGHRWLVWVEGSAHGTGAPGTREVAPLPPPASTNGVAHATSPLAGDATSPAGESFGEPAPSVPPPDGQAELPPQGTGETLVGAGRAEEMARYTTALLEPWRRRVEELSRENGHLEERAEHLRAELALARAQLAEATAPPPETERAPVAATEAADDGADRPWWRRAWAWAKGDQATPGPAAGQTTWPPA